MKKVDWDKESLLGRVPDEVLASAHRVEESELQIERNKRAIQLVPRKRMLPELLLWWMQQEPKGAVRDWWHFRPRLAVHWPEVLLDLEKAWKNLIREGKLKVEGDGFVLCHGEKYDWQNLPLGRKSDPEVAKMIGSYPKVVWQARQRRGIGPMTPQDPKGREEAVRKALSEGARTFSEVKSWVLQNYGYAHERSLFRTLRALLEQGVIERVWKGRGQYWCYLIRDTGGA